LLSQIESGKVKLDMNLIDDSVGSILHYAVILTNLNEASNQKTKSKKVEIVKSWIENEGVEINIKNKFGETPLHMTKNVDVARVLLHKGAVMNICEITGKMPLFGFVLRDNFDVCIEMLKSGCDIENIDRCGNSLLYAILNSNAPIKFILLLLEAGVALNRKEWKDCRIMKKYPKLAKAIEYRKRNPPSLKELARRSLRVHLNKVNQAKSIVNSVNKLEKSIPASLQDYILLL
jgi:ankyrin repeat protein